MFSDDVSFKENNLISWVVIEPPDGQKSQENIIYIVSAGVITDRRSELGLTLEPLQSQTTGWDKWKVKLNLFFDEVMWEVPFWSHCPGRRLDV